MASTPPRKQIAFPTHLSTQDHNDLLATHKLQEDVEGSLGRIQQIIKEIDDRLLKLEGSQPKSVPTYFFEVSLSATANVVASFARAKLKGLSHVFLIGAQAVDSSFSVAKTWLVTVQKSINTDWQLALPLSAAAPHPAGTNDFDLDIKQIDASGEVDFRIRRSGGATATKVEITVVVLGDKTDVVEKITGAGTSVAPTTIYPNTQITQLGTQVGIGIKVPANYLDVVQPTITAAAAVLKLAGTWNAAGVQFFANIIDIVDTASLATSCFVSYRISTAAKFNLLKNGQISVYGGAAPTDGQTFIGSTAGGSWTASTLTAGAGIVITNGSGSITITASGSGGGGIGGFTANSDIYANAAGVLTSTANPTNGQLLVGSTGSIPVLATITGTPNEITVTNGAGSITLSLVIPLLATKGGTGFASYAVGDILYADTTTTLAKRADVAAGSYLRSGGVNTAPVWSTLTLPNSATTGDILIATGTNAVGSLAAVATGQVLKSAGTGTAPAWTSTPTVTSLTLSSTGAALTLSGSTDLGGIAVNSLGIARFGINMPSLLGEQDNTVQGAFFSFDVRAGQRCFSLFTKVASSSTETERLGIGSNGDIVLGGGASAAAGKVMYTNGGGLQVGAPTGGDKGSGTANFSADVYKNNSAYTNPKWVLRHFYTGSVDESGPFAPPAPYYGLRPLGETEALTRQYHDLPLMRMSPDGGLFSRGDLVLASLEEAYLYIFQLHHHLEELERRLAYVERERS